MSRRVTAQDVIAALYRAVDEERLPWLDELLVTAGFLRRCPCGAMAPADEYCHQCGVRQDEPDEDSIFTIHRCAPEATFKMIRRSENDAPLHIRIAAAGGGTVGTAYADNDWIYEVRVAGTPVCSGADLHSGGLARTHEQMAAVLAGHLADSDEVPALHQHRERLTSWARFIHACEQQQ